ncbi:MAG: hypothetical protein ACXABF_16110 [Candidatus Thorarchaeota archaeon]|jgi:hypothetical protein
MKEEHEKKIMEKTRNMPKGTPVAIETQGRIFEGVIERANNNFDYETLEDNWFIEFTHTTPGLEGRYGYWKQSEDGGECDFPDDDLDAWERQAGLNRGRP